jgi:flavodoxin
MKTLIVYFSYEGNSALIAKLIKAAVPDADTLELELEDEKRRTGLTKFAWGGMQVMTRAKPKLKPYTVAVDQYDLIILGTPVWAGSFSPPIASFLSRTKINGKRLGLFCCHAGGKGKALDKLKAELAGNTFAGTIDFINPRRLDREETAGRIRDWVHSLQ